jgi:hypothetical protein
MQYCAKPDVKYPVRPIANQTVDRGKIRLGGASRLPVKTTDSGKIRLGGASRLPVRTA